MQIRSPTSLSLSTPVEYRVFRAECDVPEQRSPEQPYAVLRAIPAELWPCKRGLSILLLMLVHVGKVMNPPNSPPLDTLSSSSSSIFLAFARTVLALGQLSKPYYRNALFTAPKHHLFSGTIQRQQTSPATFAMYVVLPHGPTFAAHCAGWEHTQAHY
jgi:hypothetical protein